MVTFAPATLFHLVRKEVILQKIAVPGQIGDKSPHGEIAAP